ncbi:MAG: hypothetical protein ACYDG3_12625 [Bacillati bacterium]
MAEQAAQAVLNYFDGQDGPQIAPPPINGGPGSVPQHLSAAEKNTLNSLVQAAAQLGISRSAVAAGVTALIKQMQAQGQIAQGQIDTYA